MSPNTTPMLPSVSAQKPVVTGASEGASAAVSLMAIVAGERSAGCFDPGYRRLATACQRRTIASARGAELPRKHAPAPANGKIVAASGFEIRRERRVLAHQRDGHPAVRSQRRVVRK